MVLTKEYRICMPMTVEEYRIGQLYMIARHSFEQSSNGEGVEVIANEQITDDVNGLGQYTEKRIHLSSHLPYWIQSLIPKIFYVTEKAWNYYPYTITEYTCSFIPKFSISIQTRYEDNNGTTENCLGLTPEELELREVDFIDIAFDEVKPHHYKESEDPKLFKSEKSGRGPLVEGWRDNDKPVMCCYKVVHAKFEVWGLQTKVEEYVQGAIRDILLLGHIQAFAWMDEWFNMTIEDVRSYEKEMQDKTNMKIKIALEENEEQKDDSRKSSQPATPKSPKTPSATTPSAESKSWFSWS
ncbi:Cytoplasmic phosphatidylinositol transfer protein 1 [Danaus plexippus plexippus]|uniref:Cytoplasmic phosphatidylinositol transfer protein 1 n=2 Tax=Danaus plexippus TaxID=13037 RepID=A0A212EQQ6_DANPL|nr:Cytoplasmic phosphatidylinositol transfer protein 1 [Danaus plexippus plexippus]QDQ16915.1 retinal degeneration B beta [Danaus plexippus]